MIHENKIIAGIGKATLKTSVDKSFPVTGETVTLKTKTKWSRQVVFDIVKGIDDLASETRDNTSQEEFINIQVSTPGDLVQTIQAKNEISTATVKQLIMAMSRATDPYHDIVVDKEVARTDEEIEFFLVPENGYSLSREYTVEVGVYVENTIVNPVKVLTGTGGKTGERVSLGKVTVPRRGIYDVHTTMTDTVTGITTRKRLNKLVTITPRLAARPTRQQVDNGEYTEIVADSSRGVSLKMYETGANDLYCVFVLPEGQTNNNSGYYSVLDISKIPAGKDAYTFVLKKDDAREKYYSRILLTGATNTATSNENGTPQFSFDAPLVFTIDQPSPLTIWGVYYSTVNYSGCVRNTVWDGRGYHNLEKGIKFDRYSEDLYWEDAFMLLNGTSDVELFEIEICNTGFTAVMSKTDPSNTNPQFWYGNFEERNFIWHHSHVHDTTGEGYYIGYFTAGQSKVTYTGPTRTFTNLAGEMVTYVNGREYNRRAHSMEKVRIYRNVFERMGYDGMQLSNARNSEVCYNVIDGGGLRNDTDQASGISLQSMDGKIYNNVVTNFNGPGMQLGPMTNLEVFNNIVNTGQAVDAIQFLFELENPDMNPAGGDSGVINNTTVINVHNNILVAGRYTANGRNTVQMRNTRFTDNLMVNNGQNFASMTGETLQVWNDQARGNVIYKMSEFLIRLQELKIADRDNSDFRVGFDSPMAKAGIGTSFEFDFRGYKNWYSNIFPAGAFMGIYRNPDFHVDPLEILTLRVNDGASTVEDRTVSIGVTCKGIATRYRVSESQDFNDASWQDFNGTGFEFVLSREYGIKTVRVQLANVTEESQVKGVDVEYVNIPVTITGVSINNGATGTYNRTVSVSVTCSGNNAPSHYKVSESQDLTGVEWQVFTNPFSFTLGEGFGEKIIHVQVKDVNDNTSEVASASITLNEVGKRKAVVNVGYKESEISYTTPGLSVFDSDSGVTRINCQAPPTTHRSVYDITGEMLGSVVLSTSATYMYQASGVVTGDDSGVYPDKYLLHNSLYGDNKAANVWFDFTLPAGMYRVRLFCSTTTTTRPIPNDVISYNVVSGETSVKIAPPANGVQQNTSEMTGWQTVTVEEGSTLKVEFGIAVAGTYYWCPLNIIEIEEV